MLWRSKTRLCGDIVVFDVYGFRAAYPLSFEVGIQMGLNMFRRQVCGPKGILVTFFLSHLIEYRW